MRSTTRGVAVMIAAAIGCVACADNAAAPASQSDAGSATDAAVSSADAGATPARTSIEEAATRYPGSKLFVPSSTPAPAIVMLHGSEGGDEGTTAEYAEQLSKSGFVVMSLCWFHCPDTPTIIQNVSLDRTVQAAEWLKTIPETKEKKLGLFGWSRGAEQAILIGSLVHTTDTFAAIAAHAPSDTIVAAYDPNSYDDIFDTDPKTGERVFAAAWTWHDEKLFGERKLPWGSGPKIAIDAYAGPLWVSHGTADSIWEVARSERIVSLRETQPALVNDVHYWKGEDHFVGDYSPANLAAWWSTQIAFWRKHLAP